MAGNSDSDLALHRKIVELGDMNQQLIKQHDELLKHYYDMKTRYKNQVKEVVQNHSSTFIVENQGGLITDLQRLFIKTAEKPQESAPISVPSVPQGACFFGKPRDSQVVPQVPRVVAPTIIPRAFSHRSGRSVPY